MSLIHIGALTLALTVPAAGLAFLLARALDGLAAGRQATLLWRTARFAALSPLAVAPALPVLDGMRSLFPAGTSAQTSAAQPAAVTPVFELPSFLIDAAGEGGAALTFALWVVAALYLAGLALSGFRLLRRRGVVRRLVAGSQPAGPVLGALAARAERAAGLAPGSAELRVVDTKVTPFVAGLRPVVIVPRALGAGSVARFALIHEFTHVRRRDEVDRLLGEWLAGLLWFNPFFAAIEARLAGARELACDAQALAALAPQERRSYGEALAATARMTCRAPETAAITAFFGEPRGLQARRMRAILGHGPRPRPAATLAAALALLAATAMPVAASQHIAAQWAGAVALATVQEDRALSAEVGRLVMEAQESLVEQDHEVALSILDRLASREDLSAYEASVVHRLKGQTYFGLERYGEAILEFEAAIGTGALDGHDEATLRINIGQLYMATGDVETGTEWLESALETGYEPNAALSKVLAQAYAQQERWQEGRPWLERVLEQDGRLSRNDLLLAAAYYEALGETALAEEMRARREAMAETP